MHECLFNFFVVAVGVAGGGQGESLKAIKSLVSRKWDRCILKIKNEFLFKRMHVEHSSKKVKL